MNNRESKRIHKEMCYRKSSWLYDVSFVWWRINLTSQVNARHNTWLVKEHDVADQGTPCDFTRKWISELRPLQTNPHVTSPARGWLAGCFVGKWFPLEVILHYKGRKPGEEPREHKENPRRPSMRAGVTESVVRRDLNPGQFHFSGNKRVFQPLHCCSRYRCSREGAGGSVGKSCPKASSSFKPEAEHHLSNSSNRCCATVLVQHLS